MKYYGAVIQIIFFFSDQFVIMPKDVGISLKQKLKILKVLNTKD
jgi:hypothetical protein